MSKGTTIYIINDQSDKSLTAFRTEEQAIKYIENVACKSHDEWDWDTGDCVANSDDMIWYEKGTLFE